MVSISNQLDSYVCSQCLDVFDLFSDCCWNSHLVVVNSHLPISLGVCTRVTQIANSLATKHIFCSIGGSSAEVLQRSSDKNGWTSQKCQQKHLTRCTNSCLNIVDLTWHVQFRDVDACRDQLHIGSWRRCAHPVWCVRIRMWDLGGLEFFEGTFGRCTFLILRRECQHVQSWLWIWITSNNYEF